MINIVVSGLLLFGSLLALLAAIGLYRLPDLPTRMHATTKAGVLGSSLIMIAVVVAFAEIHVTARALAIICFTILTSPVAAHVIGRASYFVGVPLWDKTVKDELKDSYDTDTHYLRSGFEEENE
jgi:multicomponent Na+:H+ antiporter subunit G